MDFMRIIAGVNKLLKSEPESFENHSKTLKTTLTQKVESCPKLNRVAYSTLLVEILQQYLTNVS